MPETGRIGGFAMKIPRAASYASRVRPSRTDAKCAEVGMVMVPSLAR